MRYGRLRRIGKRIAIGMDNDLWIVIHLMIAGRLHWRLAGAKLAGRNSLAAFDFAGGSLVLTEAGTKRRAALHVVAGGQALRMMDPGGIDVLSNTFEEFWAALTAENRTLKRALTDPRILSGIGNAYSDEILHAARLSPIALTHKLNAEEWLRLYSATQATLEMWVDRLRSEAERGFPKRLLRFARRWPCMGVSAGHARDAARRFSAFVTPKMKRITAFAARRAGNCSPTVRYLVCSVPIGRGRWTSSGAQGAAVFR